MGTRAGGQADPGLAGSPALLSLRSDESITVTGSKRIGLPSCTASRPSRCCRRHRNSTFGLTPLACATFGGRWGANKIGLRSPPIETAKGWLLLYHGVRQTAAGGIYRLGLALFDLEKPEVCLQRGDSWIFGPEAPYEREGNVNNVVFPCGQTIGADGNTIHLYYGRLMNAWRCRPAVSVPF